MPAHDIAIPGLASRALLHLPAGQPPRAGVVTLHPSHLPDPDQPIFAHLAATLLPLGYAVLSYTRRPKHGGDVPYQLQAQDANTAQAWLRAELSVPVGLWAFSQGTWVAGIVAAGNPAIAFLALLGCPGVSPAEQMHYYTSELLRRSGFGDDARQELLTLRAAVEDLHRGKAERTEVAALLRECATKPWFEHAWLPPELPADLRPWTDMDFDPKPCYAQVGCPVLLIFGADEECVPVDASVAAWAGHPSLSVVKLPGLGHWPGPVSPGDREARSVGKIDDSYTNALRTWFGALRTAEI